MNMKKQNKKPPKIAEHLISRMFPDDNYHTSVSDLQEDYDLMQSEKGRVYSLAWYWLQLIFALPHFFTIRLKWSYDMFKNYLKIALRNFKRQKGFTFINVFGLAVGITCFLLIMMYVKYELSYDSFHTKSDRIFRIGMYWDAWSFRGSSNFAQTNGAMAPVLPGIFPEIEYAVRIHQVTSSLKYEQNSVVENGIYADKDFLNVFSFPLITGDPNTALKDPYSIVLTEKVSRKLFGSENPIGKVLSGLRGYRLTVTGVCKDTPDNSHLKFDFLLSFRTMYSQRDDIDTSWGILNYVNYILLKEHVSYKDFEKKLAYLVENYYPPEQAVRRFFLQPVRSIHLNSHINGEISQNSDIKYIYLFSTIAVLILIIAGVNYINLAVSRAAVRSKEVGIRKTVGALRSSLMRQFLGESVILTIFGFIASLMIVYFVHPVFKSVVNRDIPLSIIFHPVFFVVLLCVIIVVGFLSGCYPAFILSSFRPVNVLRTGIKSDRPGNRFRLRNILVVFQFCVTVILIVATIVIYKQLYFIRHKDLGYNRDNIVTVTLWNRQDADKYETVKEELLKNSNIINAAISDRAPLRASENNRIRVENETDGEMAVLEQVSHFYVDFNFIDLYNIEIKEGRNFSPEFPSDRQQAVIINETLVKMIGLQNPIGKRISAGGARDAKIIGVVKDFHYSSFSYKIGAVAFVYRPQWAVKMMSVKITNKNIQGTLSYIDETFRKHINDFVFDYSFLENSFNYLYDSEERMLNLFSGFSLIAILIASFGLFGLISFIAVQKTKEIGIRKVLGASVIRIIGLVVQEFAVKILISCMIALPVSYIVMNNWLLNFEYRTNISIQVMLISSLTAFMIAALSIIFQVIRAASANPVDSLRNE